MADLSARKLCEVVEPDYRPVGFEEDVEMRAPQLAERLSRPDSKDLLFDYQWELAAQVEHLALDRRAALLSLPTGGGKTRTAVGAVLDMLLSGHVHRVAWLAPTIELLDQAHGTFVRLWEAGAGPSVLGLNRTGAQNADSFIWLTTPQSVNAAAPAEYDFVVFDEAHQLQAPTFEDAVKKVRGKVRVGLLGLSATPGRSKEDEIKELVAIFDEHLIHSKILGNQPVKALRDRGVLSHISFQRVSTAPTPLSRFKDSVLLCRNLLDQNRKVLFFGRTLEDADAMQRLMSFYGYPSWYVDGGTPSDVRRGRLQQFAEAEYGILTNQKLLTTGYDCPAVTDVVLGSRVGSAILFEQMVGRASRGPRVGGSETATVWQFDDHLSIHGEPQAHIRFAEGHWGVG